MKSQRFSAYVLCGLLTAFVMTGCSILPQSEPTTLYQLPPAHIVASGSHLCPVALCIAQPQANGLLDSPRIAVSPTQSTLSAYPAVRWQSALPTLWQNYLIDAFQRDGRIASIVSDRQDLYADYILDTTIHTFNSAYHHGDDGAVQVTIVLDVHLSQRVSKRIVSSQRFTAQAPVAGEQVAAVVSSFGQASNVIAQQLTDWVCHHIKE